MLIQPYPLQQFCLIVYHFGLKSALKLVTRWPALLILPCFSPFAFSGERHDGKKVLVVSKKWTFVNSTLNILCATCGILLLFDKNLTLSLLTSLPLLGFSLGLTVLIFGCKSLTSRTRCIFAKDNTVLSMNQCSQTLEMTNMEDMSSIEPK